VRAWYHPGKCCHHSKEDLPTENPDEATDADRGPAGFCVPGLRESSLARTLHDNKDRTPPTKHSGERRQVSLRSRRSVQNLSVVIKTVNYPRTSHTISYNMV